MLKKYGVFVFAAIAACYGCAAQGPVRLDDRVTNVLNSNPVTVIYIDPAQPLGGYLRGDGPEPDPYLMTRGATGGASAALVADLIQEHRIKDVVEAFEPYAVDIAKLPYVDQLYAASQEALSQVPWLKNATWQRLKANGDKHQVDDVVLRAPTKYVIVLMPETWLRDDADQVMVHLQLDVYRQDRVSSRTGSDRMRDNTFDSLWPVPADTAYPNLDYTKHDQDDVQAKSMSELFADGGGKLEQEITGTLPRYKAQILYFLTGTTPAAEK